MTFVAILLWMSFISGKRGERSSHVPVLERAARESCATLLLRAYDSLLCEYCGTMEAKPRRGIIWTL